MSEQAKIVVWRMTLGPRGHRVAVFVGPEWDPFQRQPVYCGRCHEQRYFVLGGPARLLEVKWLLFVAGLRGDETSRAPA